MSTSVNSNKQQQQQQPPSEEVMEQQEITTAAAILSLSGPCRAIGDIYLTCVATAGLGMCKQYRSSYEQCTRETSTQSTSILRSIGDDMYEDIPNPKERLLNAARTVNMQSLSHMYAPQDPSSSSSSSQQN